MPRIGLTDIQKQLKTKLGDDALAMAIIDMVDAGITSNGINNTAPAYVATADYFETKNGHTIWFLTVTRVTPF